MSSGPHSNRVLLVNLGAVFGGAEVYIEELVQLLEEQTECYVLCSNAELQRRLCKLNVHLICFPQATNILKAFQMLAATVILPFIILRHKIHTVQINGYSEILLIPVTRLMGRRAIATRHLTFDIEVAHRSKAPGRYIARFLYRHLAQYAHSVICVSRSVGKEVRPLVPPGRMTVIPNWVAVVPPMRIKSLPRESPITILFVGRLIELKGLQVLIEAMRVVASTAAAPLVKLIVVGDGDYRPELESKASGLDITFEGFQADVTSYYEKADIFISPSFGPEGSSLVVLDAMAFCIPCILSDIPAYSEIAHGGAGAMLFHRGDSHDLAECLRTMVTNEELRKSCVEFAYGSILRNHVREVAAKSFLEVLGVEPACTFPQCEIENSPIHETEASISQ